MTGCAIAQMAESVHEVLTMCFQSKKQLVHEVLTMCFPEQEMPKSVQTKVYNMPMDANI
jgi:hypothetical protein